MNLARRHISELQGEWGYAGFCSWMCRWCLVGKHICYLPPTPAPLGIGSRDKSSGAASSDARGKIFVSGRFVLFSRSHCAETGYRRDAPTGPFSLSGDRRPACPTPNRLNTQTQSAIPPPASGIYWFSSFIIRRMSSRGDLGALGSGSSLGSGASVPTSRVTLMRNFTFRQLG